MAPMSKLITKPPKPPLKKVVCKLLGVPETKTVQFRLDSGVKTLQHQIKTKFNSSVNARDLMLFPTKHRYFETWLGINDEVVEVLTKADSPAELEKILHYNELFDGKNILPEVFRSAPEEGVIHVVAKECPVHPTRAARWEDIQRILPPQEPFEVGKKQTTPRPSKWHELYERTYEPQLQHHLEAVTPIDPKIIGELVETLEEPRGAFAVDLAHEFHLHDMLMPCKRRHPDLAVGSGGFGWGRRGLPRQVPWVPGHLGALQGQHHLTRSDQVRRRQARHRSHTDAM